VVGFEQNVFFFSKLISSKHALNQVEILSWSVKVAFTVVVIAVHSLAWHGAGKAKKK